MKMKKIISSLLVTVLTITLFSFTTQPETIASESQTTQNNSVFVDNTLDLSDLPDIITKEEQEAAKYIDRSSSYETGLNMLVFKSADGTHTKKVYSYPEK